MLPSPARNWHRRSKHYRPCVLAPWRREPRGDQDQRHRDGERPRRRRQSQQDQQAGRDHRRGITQHAEIGDVAALHADIPDQEGRTDGTEAQQRQRNPRLCALRCRPVFEHEAAHKGERRGDEAGQGKTFARHRGDEPRHHRIARPHQRAAEGEHEAERRMWKIIRAAHLVPYQQRGRA